MDLTASADSVSNADHSAAAPALGYLYQAKMALLELIRGSAARPDAEISLELYDDVAWSAEGTPLELLQLKHHTAPGRSLTDKSDDLWRTIAVWMDLRDPLNPDGPLLSLVTTESAAEGSGCALLRPGPGLDIDGALLALASAAASSGSTASKEVRQRFLLMKEAERRFFVGRVRVLDGAPRIEDVDDLVRTELRLTIPIGRDRPFMERLWGWWYGRVVEMLRRETKSISLLALRIFLSDLQGEFVEENLPTFDELQIGIGDVAPYQDRPFVHQLRWIASAEAILHRSILDYYKAYSHTVRWLEEDLVGIEELQRFEARLKEEWDLAFAFVLQELPAGATEDEKQTAGRGLLQLTLARLDLRVRDRYGEPFFMRGKHHELADSGAVGWHPEFRAKIDELLLSRTA
jgi:ABC-3C protein